MQNNSAFWTASEVVSAVRARQISAVEVLEAQLNRIARHNPELNAIVTLDESGARRRAKEADEALERGEVWGALHGLPVTIKDVYEVAGMRSTCSHKPFADNIPQQDAAAVARLRAAGAVIIGKTNLPELALDFQTDSPLFGRSNNPWDLKRTPGGSTGGGAAAVAAGLSYLELGSDLAGSIRIPAHFCGVYGLVPSENLVPRAGHLPKQAPGGTISHFLRVGALARSIADLKLCLSVIAGADANEPDLMPITLVEPAPRQLKDLRIAWTDDVGGVPVSASTRSALQAFAAKLTELGCHVERTSPAKFDFEQARQIHDLILMTVLGTTLPTVPRLMGRIFGGVRAFDLDLKRYLQAEKQRMALIAVMDEFLAGWDAWICPVTSTPAFEHHKPDRTFGPSPVYIKPIPLDEGTTINYYTANTSFTKPLNVTGNPVVTMPIGQSAQGLPIGAQVVGRRWHDVELLAVAGCLAEAMGPLPHPPRYNP